MPTIQKVMPNLHSSSTESLLSSTGRGWMKRSWPRRVPQQQPLLPLQMCCLCLSHHELPEVTLKPHHQGAIGLPLRDDTHRPLV